MNPNIGHWSHKKTTDYLFNIVTVEEAADRAREHNAAGDGADVTSDKVASPRKDENVISSTENIEKTVEWQMLLND